MKAFGVFFFAITAISIIVGFTIMIVGVVITDEMVKIVGLYVILAGSCTFIGIMAGIGIGEIIYD